MKKRYKVLIILFLIVLINSLVFLYIYLKNNVSVSLVLLGNNFTSNSEIFNKFEKRTDVFYWYLNRTRLQEEIRKLPFIRDVEIFPESLKEFNKLNIVVKEEEPLYLAKLADNQVQIISNDGKMLSYLTNDEAFLRNSDFFQNLPVVLGLDTGLDSSQTLNSRLIYIANFIKNIRKEIPQTIVSMLFLPSGEVKVKFIGLSPLVVLDLSKGDEWVDTQLKRFNAIKENKELDVNRMSEIDLSFKKVGVLKLRK